MARRRRSLNNPTTPLAPGVTCASDAVVMSRTTPPRCVGDPPRSRLPRTWRTLGCCRRRSRGVATGHGRAAARLMRATTSTFVLHANDDDRAAATARYNNIVVVDARRIVAEQSAEVSNDMAHNDLVA